MAKNQRGNKRIVLWRLACVAAFLLICALISWNETRETPFMPTVAELFGSQDEQTASQGGELLVEMIDVGNADALLVRSSGQSLLIDAGERGDGETVLAHLRDSGVETLDYVIATHADSDHIGGMQTVLTGIPVKRYIMAFMPKGHTPTTKTYLNLLKTIDERDIPLTEARAGEQFPLGEATVELLGPADDFTDNNNQSVVCRIVFGSRKFLFMGDAGTAAEQALLASGATLSADVLKVGHHGSVSSSSMAFLQRVLPSYALITCGTGNSYGHPHKEVLSRLQKMNVRVYRADLNGTVRLVCDGETIRITAEKGEAS